MVFYFTGTGNSLYAAKRLEKHPISIPQVIGKENLAFAADAIGVVAPVYGHEVPPMVKEFLKKAAFQTEYFYLILTYGCRHGAAVKPAWPAFMRAPTKPMGCMSRREAPKTAAAMSTFPCRKLSGLIFKKHPFKLERYRRT